MDSVWNTVIGQLPSEVLSYLGGHSLNVVAWGCGEEIGPLKSRFPHCRTMTADSENQSDLPRSVEVLFSINYLPQFSEPLEELKNLLNLRSSVAIFVVPQSEFPLRENHRSQFRQENFPELLAGFSRSTLKTIQLETERGLESHLLVIYSSETFRKLYGTTDVAQAEMDKWNQYYSGLESVTETPSLQAFHGEFTEAMVDLLPPSSRILEAGCGAAFQSLALARLGRFDISVMDISNEALTSARQRFDQAHLPVDAFLGDTFAPGKPEFDLVFNAGVLEHYTLNEQVDFIRGMASRSRNFVLILVPNRLCYWYWMWRIHISKKEAWPFGKECPMVDMSTAFEKAGLRFVGQTFFGEAWTEDLIHHLPGLSQEIREDILGIHRSPFLDKSHKCYLLAALGTVAEQTAEIPDIWSSTGLREDFRTAEITGALADTLAGKLSLESRMRSTQQVYEAALAENRYYRSLVYSKVWRIAERVQKIRNIVAPEGSWRSLTLRKMKNGIKKIGSVTIQGIRNIIPAPKGLDEIQQKAANGQQVVVFLPSIRWQATLFQRPQHLARQFAKMGYVTIYDCTETDEKLYGFKELEPNLYLYKGPTRHLASLPNPWLWAFTYNFHL